MLFAHGRHAKWSVFIVFLSLMMCVVKQLLGEEKTMRTLAALIVLATLSACVDSSQSSWDRQVAFADPSFKPNYSTMRPLEQPGIY